LLISDQSRYRLDVAGMVNSHAIRLLAKKEGNNITASATRSPR
jgi:hypothetical protein